MTLQRIVLLGDPSEFCTPPWFHQYEQIGAAVMPISRVHSWPFTRT